MAVVVADIGGTHTRLALLGGKVGFTAEISHKTDKNVDGITTLTHQIRSLVAEHQIEAVIGGMPGQLRPGSGELYGAPNLPGWQGRRVAAELGAVLDAPIWFENDVAMGGLGEAHFGAGRGFGIVMYQTVSTGVNAVRIVNGRIDVSARGFDVGQQLIPTHDGRMTTLEAATGGAALERRYGRPPAQLASKRLWSSEAGLLALGLHNSLVHWSPEVVVLGGAMMHDISIDEVRRELIALAPDRDYPPLVPAHLGDQMGLHGAVVRAGQLGYF